MKAELWQIEKKSNLESGHSSEFLALKALLFVSFPIMCFSFFLLACTALFHQYFMISDIESWVFLACNQGSSVCSDSPNHQYELVGNIPVFLNVRRVNSRCFRASVSFHMKTTLAHSQLLGTTRSVPFPCSFPPLR